MEACIMPIGILQCSIMPPPKIEDIEQPPTNMKIDLPGLDRSPIKTAIALPRAAGNSHFITAINFSANEVSIFLLSSHCFVKIHCYLAMPSVVRVHAIGIGINVWVILVIGIKQLDI